MKPAGDLAAVPLDHRRALCPTPVGGVRTSRMEGAPRRNVAELRHVPFDLRQAIDAFPQRWDCSHKTLGIGVRRMIDDGLDRPRLDETPGIHDGDPVGSFGDYPHIVGDQQACRFVFAAERFQQGDDLSLDRDVERRRRFVRDDELRIGGQCQGRSRCVGASRPNRHAGSCRGALPATECRRRVADPRRARGPAGGTDRYGFGSFG